jgi:hypothetical protein
VAQDVPERARVLRRDGGGGLTAWVSP